MEWTWCSCPLPKVSGWMSQLLTMDVICNNWI
jgi:hypothetical protein